MQPTKAIKFTISLPLSPILQLYNNLKKLELKILKTQSFILKGTSISLLPTSPLNSQRKHIPNSKNPTLLHPSPPAQCHISHIRRLNPTNPHQRERNKSQSENPTDNAEGDDLQILPLQTHRASTWTTKISSFKRVSYRNLALVATQAKNKLLWEPYASKWTRNQHVNLPIPTLQVVWNKNSSQQKTPQNKTSLPASKANKLQILSYSQPLTLLRKVEFR